MPELRWALMGLGAAFIVALAIWEWRRSRRRLAQSPEGATASDDWSRRVEPRLDSLGDHGPADVREPAMRDVPVIHPSDPPVQRAVPVAREVAVDRPSAAVPPPPAQPEPAAIDPEPELPDPPAAVEPAAPKVQAAPAAAARREIRWPPERADRVLTLRLVSSRGALLAGREVRLALEQASLVPGPQKIYHLTDADGAVLVSAANMLRPGDLDPLKVDEEQLRGLSLFSVLPGPLPAVRMLEELVAVARAVSWRLGASVQDEHGAELEGDVLLRLRQSLPDDAEQENG
ncbi:MAG TPA: cell division protein ZipA C-terminal FtsZ-binding domain-containing protein [Steroidobacteraceae bacterium]|nr:cell division protein ZipA C-terminal FtsZ-binding domain-containing protein [Steroidobacteraceae bacterium]